jgi:hypothetical protein
LLPGFISCHMTPVYEAWLLRACTLDNQGIYTYTAYTLPCIHSAVHTLYHAYTLPCIHSVMHTLCHAYTMPCIHYAIHLCHAPLPCIHNAVHTLCYTPLPCASAMHHFHAFCRAPLSCIPSIYNYLNAFCHAVLPCGPVSPVMSFSHAAVNTMF